MKNVIAGNASCSNSPAPTAYRRNLMDLLAASPVITDEEYDTATGRILACQDVATLQRWYRNCIREIARREEAEATPAPVRYATPTQTDEIHKLTLHRVISKAERSQAILHLPSMDYAQAAALIGELWAKITLRTQEVALSTVSAC